MDLIYVAVSTTLNLISICSCLWIFFFLCSDKNLRVFIEGNSLLISWFLLIPPGLLLVVVFLIENTHQIYFQENLQDGKLCKFCGFIAILTLTALNGSSTTISYLTYLAVKTGKKPPTGHAIYGNLLSWILGVAIACVYLTGNVLGPYRELYCCVKQDKYQGKLVGEMFMVCGVAASGQIFFYTSSYFEALKHNRAGNTSRTRTSDIIMRRGLEIVSSYWMSYLLIIIEGVIIFLTNNPPIWLTIIAAWLPKLEPLWHCLLIYRILKRILKHKAKIRIHPQPQPQQNTDLNPKKSHISRVLSILQSVSSVKDKSKQYSLISVRKAIQQVEEMKSPRN